MPTCVVVTDPETADGFRLAGVEVLPVCSPEETERLVRGILGNERYGLVVVKESLLADLSEALLRRLERAALPLVVPVPLDIQWRRQERSMEYLLRLIRRSIGYHMRIKGEHRRA